MRRCNALAMFLAAMLSVAACGDSDSSDDGSSGITLPDEAKSFAEYRLYYLGAAYGDLPLTYAELGPGSGEGIRRAFDFIYGSCTPSGDDGGCAPPLDVQNWSICTRFPALYPGPTPETDPLHGAQTHPAGGGLDVYTGRTTVVIFGQGSHKPEIVQSLRRVADGVKPRRLPPPAPGALEGKLPCQQDRLERFTR
jgi:hypothetical protein